jgi:hypothetical protein
MTNLALTIQYLAWQHSEQKANLLGILYACAQGFPAPWQRRPLKQSKNENREQNYHLTLVLFFNLNLPGHPQSIVLTKS